MLYTVKTPLKIRFSKEVVEKLNKRYNSTFEKGGVLIAIPKLDGVFRVLDVEDIIFLKNLSKHPEKEFKFRVRDIAVVWKKTLKTQNKLCIPIHFHTHPSIIKDFSNPNELFSTLMPMATSKADQKTSKNLIINMLTVKFLIPSALIVKATPLRGRLLVGFYGGGITPTNFSEYLTKLTGKSLDEFMTVLTDWIKQNPNKNKFLVLLLVITVILAFLHPKKVLAIVGIFGIFAALFLSATGLFRQAIDKYPNYFALLEKDVVVHIPKYSWKTSKK